MADPPTNECDVDTEPLAPARFTVSVAGSRGAAHLTASPSRSRPEVVADRYLLTEQLGAGGTGTVWLAHDQVLGREVALKQFHAQGSDGSAWALREARAAARISHSNVVAVYDVVAGQGDHAWLVMEALTGESLSAAIGRTGRLSVARVDQIAGRLLSALDRLHAAGVVHRDVKPSNVHLASDGRVVLTDFGVAASVTRTRSDNDLLIGTFGYIAPESVIDGNYSAASDMYGLGATLYCAVQGARPFNIRTLDDLVEHAAFSVEAPCPDQANWLAPMITGLLEPCPDDRWTATTARTHLRTHRPAFHGRGRRRHDATGRAEDRSPT